jgi:hypothetical protein
VQQYWPQAQPLQPMPPPGRPPPHLWQAQPPSEPPPLPPPPFPPPEPPPRMDMWRQREVPAPPGRPIPKIVPLQVPKIIPLLRQTAKGAVQPKVPPPKSLLMHISSRGPALRAVIHHAPQSPTGAAT